MAATAQDRLWVAPASIDDGPVDSIHVTADRYTVSLGTDHDIYSFARAVAGTGSDQYTVTPGSDWADSGIPEEREEPGIPLQDEEDAVHIQQGTLDDRYTRSFYAPDGRSDAEISVTVPKQAGDYPVAPVHDALDPFYDDREVLDAATAVEAALDRFADGDIDQITI